MGIFKPSSLSALLSKFQGKGDEKMSESIVVPSKPISPIVNSRQFNSDTYQYENEVDEIENEMYYENEIQYEEGADYDSNDCDLESNEDVYYDFYDSATDDDDEYI